MSNSVVVVARIGDTSVSVPEVGALNSKEQHEYDALLADGHSWQEKGRHAMIRFGGVLRDIKASAVVGKRHGPGGWAALVEREFGISRSNANSIITFTKVQDALLAVEVAGVPVTLSVTAAEAIAPVIFPESTSGAGNGRGEATPESVAEAVTVLTEAAESSPSGKATAEAITEVIATGSAPTPPAAPPVPHLFARMTQAQFTAKFVAHDPAICVVTVKYNRGRAIELPCPGWPNPIPGFSWTYMADSDGQHTLYFDNTDPVKGWFRTAHNWKGGGAKP